MSGEWNACETVSRRVFSNRAAIATTASSAPATTTERGPFTAAIETSAPSSGRTSSSVACNAIIAPPHGQRLHQRAAGGDERGRVFEGKDARGVSRGDLADRVAA